MALIAEIAHGRSSPVGNRRPEDGKPKEKIMNKDRRKTLADIKDRIEALTSEQGAIEEARDALATEIEKQWADLVGNYEALKEKMAELASEVETVRDEEQEAFDNMPEGLQAAERGEQSQAAVSEMEDAINSLQDGLVDLDEPTVPDLDFSCIEEAAASLEMAMEG